MMCWLGGKGLLLPDRALPDRQRRLRAAAVLLAGFAAAGLPVRADDRREDVAEVLAVIERFKEKDPGLAHAFEDAYGYAVFPTVAKGGIGLGGARGKGYVYQRGRLVGRSTLTQVTVGLQLGGQAYSEVVFFKTRAALADFKRGRLKLDAQASAVALDKRAAGDLAYRKGVAIVTMAKGGLMYEASVGGQKFSYRPLDK
jgi:lipid-binding SYLF domain-containing protein